MSRYERAATAASMVRIIQGNVRPWSVANSALANMQDPAFFSELEVARVRQFLETLRGQNTLADADGLATAIEKLIREIEPSAVIT